MLSKYKNVKANIAAEKAEHNALSGGGVVRIMREISLARRNIVARASSYIGSCIDYRRRQTWHAARVDEGSAASSRESVSWREEKLQAEHHAEREWRAANEA